MKKMLGLLLTAVTLVAAVPKSASAAEIPSRDRCWGVNSTCRRSLPPVGGRQSLLPVSGGKQSLSSVKG
ncbi:MAG: hypothetical protein ACRD1P_10345 [Thermoanaerobaculia bacterium]